MRLIFACLFTARIRFSPGFSPIPAWIPWLPYLALLALTSCSAAEESTDDILAPTKTIIVGDSTFIPDSSQSIFRNVDFVVFEQSPLSSFSTIDKIIHYKNRWIILDRLVASKVLAFDTSGKFLLAYGSKGVSPGQYVIPMDIFLDTFRKELLVLNSERRLINFYDFEKGSFLRSQKYDFSAKQFHRLASGDFIFLGGSQQDRVLLTNDRLEKKTSAIPFLPRYSTMLINQIQANEDSVLTFRLSYNDTVYQIGAGGKVHPYRIFDFGPQRLTDQFYEQLTAAEKGRLQDHVLDKKTSLVAYAENKDQIYVVYRYQGKIHSYLQNKTTGSSIALRNDQFADRLLPVDLLPIIIGKDGSGNFLAALKPEDFLSNKGLQIGSDIQLTEFSNPVLVKLQFK